MEKNIFDLLDMVGNPKDRLLNEEFNKIINSLRKNLEIPQYSSLHKGDIDIDISMLLDDENECEDYIWVVRQGGTHLYNEKNLFSSCSQEHISFKYFKNYPRYMYRLRVNRRDKITKKVYGELTLLNTNSFTEKVLRESKEHDYCLCKVLTIDGEIIKEKIETAKGFKNSKIFLNILSGSCDKIKKVYYLKYYN